MSFLSLLVGGATSTEKMADDILDKDKGLLVRAGEGLGKLHYSDQEKSEAAAQRDKEVHEWSINMLNALVPMPVLQRGTVVIALTAAGGWLLGLILMFAGMVIESMTCPDPELMQMMHEHALQGGEHAALSLDAAMSCIRFEGLLEKFLQSDYAFWPMMLAFLTFLGQGIEYLVKLVKLAKGG